MEVTMAGMIAVTGANGFVGRALCIEALRRGLKVRGITRAPSTLADGVESVAVGNVDAETQWEQALAGCDVVIHLAARVHIMNDKSRDPLAEFRRVNTAGTIRLAQCATRAGVRRLVNVSSIGVNGPSTEGELEFTDQDVPDPHNPYSLSKWEAEQALQVIQLQGDLEVVTVRPPLIYGPGVGGNFLSKNLSIDPARRAINGDQQIAMGIFVRHLRKIFNIDMDETGRVIFERFNRFFRPFFLWNQGFKVGNAMAL
jgi:nucleoside-diphosphate-sugar epimerase